MGKSLIPLFYPYVSSKSKRLVQQVLNTRWIGQGPKVDEFEKAFGKKFGYKYCVAVNSGTAALTLAYVLAGVKRGTRVLTPVLTCTATNHPLKMLGAKLVFIDVNPWTLNYDAVDFDKKRKDSKVAVVVDFGGRVAKIPSGITTIVDAAQSLGAKRDGQADFTCFSFQAIKTLTTGDGGMLVCKNEKDYLRAKRLRWFDIDREFKRKGKYQATKPRDVNTDQCEPGYKFQMTDIAAAIGLGNLQDFDKLLAHRLKLANLYNKLLADTWDVQLLDYGEESNSYWIYMIRVKRRDEFMKKLTGRGIETNLSHIRNDVYTVFGGKKKKLPGMNEVDGEYVCLPLNWKVTPTDVRYICKVIKEGW